MNPPETFGRRVNQIKAISELLALESQEEKDKTFRQLDEIVGAILVRSLQGERIATIEQNNLKINTVRFHGLNNESRNYLESVYKLENQQSYGAWFLPEYANLRVGMMSLPWAFQEHDRFATGIALDECGRVALKSSADTVFIWATLETLFKLLFLPFELRGNLSGTLDREMVLKHWYEIDSLYRALGFQVEDELAILRWGGGWHKLKAAEQLESKKRLLQALALQVNPQMASYYRALRVQELIWGYYKKAKNSNLVKSKQVVTKALQPALSGFFGGDWLSFLTYLGETPHPDEQIFTSLPEIRPFVSGSSRAREVASLQGVPEEEIRRIAAAYWQQPSELSPVEQRVGVLKQFWLAFDDIHTRQAVGMRPLWGLVDKYNSRRFDETYWQSSWHPLQAAMQPQLYLTLLSESLVKEIDQLWGVKMEVKYPDRIVSEPFPHALMAETFGAALKLWHGCALAASFICEGPNTLQDIPGLAHYYRREIAALEALKTPIDSKIFTELIEAESQLGPFEPIYVSQAPAWMAVTEWALQNYDTIGERRNGWEKLGSIITNYRHAWADEFLDCYLRSRWETEIVEVGRAFNLLMYKQGGKPPTLKQFAKYAVAPTNHWFGGDISGLYGAIQEKMPI